MAPMAFSLSLQVSTLIERLSHEGRREKQLRRALKQALDYMTPIILSGGNTDKSKGCACHLNEAVARGGSWWLLGDRRFPAWIC